MTMNELEVELMVARETISEAEESFTQLREDYHALREHTDALEKLLRNHEIAFPEFLG